MIITPLSTYVTTEEAKVCTRRFFLKDPHRGGSAERYLKVWAGEHFEGGDRQSGLTRLRSVFFFGSNTSLLRYLPLKTFGKLQFRRL